VKGRRRARRLALQALYELDQSRHAVERVLSARVREALADVAARTLPDERAPMAARAADGVAVAILAAGEDGAQSEALRAAAREVLSEAPDADFEALWEPLGPHAAQAAFGGRIVFSVLASRAALDATIAEIAPEFPVPQMSPVDRNVLRIALWEIASGVTPLRVAINEAVELAREFSGEAARRMVNGALGAFAAGEGTQAPRPDA